MKGTYNLLNVKQDGEEDFLDVTPAELQNETSEGMAFIFLSP